MIFTAFESHFEPTYVLPETDASYRPTHRLFCILGQLSQTNTSQNSLQINNPDIQQYITNWHLNLPNLPRTTGQGMQIVPFTPRRPIKPHQKEEPFQPWQLLIILASHINPAFTTRWRPSVLTLIRDEPGDHQNAISYLQWTIRHYHYHPVTNSCFKLSLTKFNV